MKINWYRTAEDDGTKTLRGWDFINMLKRNLESLEDAVKSGEDKGKPSYEKMQAMIPRMKRYIERITREMNKGMKEEYVEEFIKKNPPPSDDITRLNRLTFPTK